MTQFLWDTALRGNVSPSSSSGLKSEKNFGPLENRIPRLFKRKAVSSFETSENVYPEARCHIAEEQIHQAHGHENIKEYIRVFHYAFVVLHKGTCPLFSLE